MKGQNPDCPCGSGARYTACCKRFHRGDEPADAVTLMRSRFSAYALGEAEYLWRTLHPEHPDRQDAGGEPAYLASVRASRRTMRFVRLRVLDHDETRVLFHAEIYEGGREKSFMERSQFKRDERGWRYLSGEPRELKAAALEARRPAPKLEDPL